MFVVDIVEESDDVFRMERLQESENSVDVQFRCLRIFHRNDCHVGIVGDFRKKLPVKFKIKELPNDDRNGFVCRLDPLDLLARKRGNERQFVHLEVHGSVFSGLRCSFGELIQIIVDQQRRLICRKLFFRDGGNHDILVSQADFQCFAEFFLQFGIQIGLFVWRKHDQKRMFGRCRCKERFAVAEHGLKRTVIIGAVSLIQNRNHTEHSEPESLLDIDIGANGQIEKFASDDDCKRKRHTEHKTDYGPDAAFASQRSVGRFGKFLNGDIGEGTVQEVLDRGNLHFRGVDLFVGLCGIIWRMTG